MIVGTAGHIDHGKTTLVRTLTGVDTDRLKEEKARGISIELGYAYTPLANGDVLGFVDVPGHERLVHTMVAGASGIDFALLVVAADDGVMPQTREHLAILDLLGVSRGAVALTKADRADNMRVHAVTRDIETLLASTPLAGSKVFAVDARADDARVAELREHLDRTATEVGARSTRGLFRLAVDRVFTLAGHGTIATGTIVSGRVAVGDTIQVMPSGRTARVRGIHAQNRPAESGRAGERCAINLAGIERSELARGDWLADPRALATTSRVDVALRTTRDRGAPIVDGAKVHVHIGTSHRTARVAALAPARAQLVLDAPLCATPGDRFILRDAAAAHTIGGGTVLDPFAPARQRRSTERLAYLDAVERMLAGEGVGPLLAGMSHGVRVSNLVRITNDASIADALPDGTVLLDGGHEPFVIAVERLHALHERVVTAATDFHAKFPDEPGVGSARLHRIALPAAPADVWTAIVKAVIDDASLVQNGAYLRRPEHRVRLSDRESALAAELMPRIAAGGFDPPWVRDLAGAVGAPEDEVRQTLRKLNAEGSLQQIVRDLFYTPERVRELAAIARRIADAHGAIEAAAYRDAIGLGRKRTVQILEFFDRVGYTRRVRDAHRLREGVSF